eukprot:gene23221-43682_t
MCTPEVRAKGSPASHMPAPYGNHAPQWCLRGRGQLYVLTALIGHGDFPYRRQNVAPVKSDAQAAPAPAPAVAPAATGPIVSSAHLV